MPKLLLIILFTSLLVSCSTAQENKKRPNILFAFADDWEDMPVLTPKPMAKELLTMLSKHPTLMQ